MINFDVEVDLGGVEEHAELKVQAAQKVIDSQVAKDSNYYIPVDEHYLEKSVFEFTNFGSGEVVWNTHYAARLYYNPQYDFSTDVNPNAGGLWFERAKASKKSVWIKMGQKAAEGV